MLFELALSLKTRVCVVVVISSFLKGVGKGGLQGYVSFFW